MSKRTEVSAPFPQEIKVLLDRVGSRKKKAVVYEVEAGKPETLYSYWDGGSRDEYRAWNAQGRLINLPIGGAPGFSQAPEPWVSQAGDVLVEFGTFCGKPSTPRITFYR